MASTTATQRLLASAAAKTAATPATTVAAAPPPATAAAAAAVVPAAAAAKTGVRKSTAPMLHVVLLSPQNGGNVGALGRTCTFAPGAVRLHLVRPLGFSLAAASLKRAGMDYWAAVDHRVHADWRACRTHLGLAGGPEGMRAYYGQYNKKKGVDDYDEPFSLRDVFGDFDDIDEDDDGASAGDPKKKKEPEAVVAPPPESPAPNVVHSPEHKQFVWLPGGAAEAAEWAASGRAATDDGDLAFVSYRQLGDNGPTLVLDHTFTPPAMRGQGLARLIGTGALRWLALHNFEDQEGHQQLRAVLKCPYLARAFGEDPEFASLVVGGGAKQPSAETAAAVTPPAPPADDPTTTADEKGSGRAFLLTTRGEKSLWDVQIRPGDTLILGSESHGAPPNVHADPAVTRIRIPGGGEAQAAAAAIAAAAGGSGGADATTSAATGSEPEAALSEEDRVRLRSLNLATSGAIALFEALRQIHTRGDQ